LEKVKKYGENLKDDVMKKAEKLNEIGYREYLSRMKK